MKKFVLLVLTCIGLHSCSKDEIRPVLPVARFETEKSFYDDGDTIKFINKSEKASSFFWSFGEMESSNEINPTFAVDLKSSWGHAFTAVLTAYSENGLETSFSQKFTISKRLLLDFHILRMEHSLEQKVAQTGDQTNLIIYLGPVNDPFEWIIPEQTIPPVTLDINSGYPQEIYVMRTWPTVVMNNELWFFRFSVQAKGDDAENRVFLKEFRFNPCKADFIINEKGIRQFVVEDDEMSIAIDFNYLNPFGL